MTDVTFLGYDPDLPAWMDLVLGGLMIVVTLACAVITVYLLKLCILLYKEERKK